MPVEKKPSKPHEEVWKPRFVNLDAYVDSVSLGHPYVVVTDPDKVRKAKEWYDSEITRLEERLQRLKKLCYTKDRTVLVREKDV